jgi:hypothetical protein
MQIAELFWAPYPIAIGIAFYTFFIGLTTEIIYNYSASPPTDYEAPLLEVIKRGNVWMGTLAAVIIGFVISGLLSVLHARVTYPKWEKRKKEIEQKEHLDPTFISWEEKVYLSSFNR